MKRLYVAVLLLVLLCFGSLNISNWINGLTSELIEEIETAYAMTKDDDWDGALEKTRESFNRWQDATFPLHVLLRHSDTDEILISFEMVIEYLKLQEMDQYAAANAQLILQLELLAEMEDPTMQNVL